MKTTTNDEATDHQMVSLWSSIIMDIKFDLSSIINFFNNFFLNKEAKREKFMLENLQLLPGIIVDELKFEFNPQSYFNKNQNMIVRTTTFDEIVLHPAESFSNLPFLFFSKGKFLSEVSDKEIMKNLYVSLLSWFKTREEILWSIAFLLDEQKNWGFDKLSITNKTIIGYFISEDLIKYAVTVEREHDLGVWICDCYEFGYLTKEIGDEMLF